MASSGESRKAAMSVLFASSRFHARSSVSQAKLISSPSSSAFVFASLAVAALSDRPILAMPDIPFLCDFRRAIDVAQAGPYPEIPAFLKSFPPLYDEVMRTLSYFDCVNLAPWIRCRTIVSNCLWDDICPPSTIFGAYNHITSEKRMDVYPYHKHEVPYEHAEMRFRTIVEMLRP